MRLRIVIVLLVLMTTVAVANAASKEDASYKPFLGRWDLTLHAPQRDYPSWLEITDKDGQLSAQFVSRWGNARPPSKISISNGVLTFVSPKSEEERPDDMIFKGKRAGAGVSGTTTGQDGTPWTWTARRAPALKRTNSGKWGKPIELFNGKDLTGWKTETPSPAKPWTIENGTLVSPGNGPDVVSDAKFQDFKLHVEFNCGPNSNSGVYLRGRYETQIETNSVQEPPSHHTGGVYGFIAPSPELPRMSGWQTFDITLIGRTVTVVQNGQTVIDHQEIPGITGGALDSHEEMAGPIYLQGGENGHVAFRNIVITPVK
jgi:hypothetical protein